MKENPRTLAPEEERSLLLSCVYRFLKLSFYFAWLPSVSFLCAPSAWRKAPTNYFISTYIKERVLSPLDFIMGYTGLLMKKLCGPSTGVPGQNNVWAQPSLDEEAQIWLNLKCLNGWVSSLKLGLSNWQSQISWSPMNNLATWWKNVEIEEEKNVIDKQFSRFESRWLTSKN